MRYLTVEEVSGLHSMIIATSGGSSGLRDRNALESAVAQPQMTFEGVDLYYDRAKGGSVRTLLDLKSSVHRR